MTDRNASSTTDAKSSSLPKLIIGGFVALVVIAETVIFFMMVPNGEQVAVLAETKLIRKIENSMEKDGEEVIEDDENREVEVSLGEYGVTFTPVGSDRNYRVDFRLFGTVRNKDQKHFEALYAAREGRYRNRMMIEIRNATLDELNENQLGLIQRRILATSNQLFDEPILLEVGFQDYQVMEE